MGNDAEKTRGTANQFAKVTQYIHHTATAEMDMASVLMTAMVHNSFPLLIVVVDGRKIQSAVPFQNQAKMSAHW